MNSGRKRPPPPRVVVPLTFGGATRPKLAAVSAQARALDACVTLLHVLDGSAPSPESPQPAAVAAAVLFLDEVAEQLRREGVGARARLRYGSVATTVLDVAREQQAAMIIVGASEPKGWQRLLPATGAGLVGAISRDAPCPVLVVRRTASDSELPHAA
jgi:nucleotide-binding universal stress UspA family protein